MPKTLLQGRDDLSGVLKPVSVHGKIYCHSELSAPWALSFPKKDDALFHLFEKGKCFLMHANEERAAVLNEGDLVILPNGLDHVLADSPETSAVSFRKLVRGIKGPSSVVRYGGGGKQTSLMCGTFELETGKDHALLRVLPEVMHIRASSLSDNWLMATIDLLAKEARNYGNGSALIVSGLINVIFVQAVRIWLQTQPENQGGFLGALQDRRIAAVIAAIHNQPEKDWDLRSLAAIAGMSRSSFAQHFSTLVGQPPLSHVTNWRMQIAAQLLRKDVNITVNKVSEQVGYFSDHAFSKAFKRYHGVPPSQFRIH